MAVEVRQKPQLVFFGTFNLDGHAEGGIEHIAGKHVCMGKLVDPRAEADALYDSLNQ